MKKKFTEVTNNPNSQTNYQTTNTDGSIFLVCQTYETGDEVPCIQTFLSQTSGDIGITPLFTQFPLIIYEVKKT